jgi:hypothetical protein
MRYFNTYPIKTLGLIDIRNNYNSIGLEFLKYYYRLWDNNFPAIGNLYCDNPAITYLDIDYTNFNNYMWSIRNQGIYKFSHWNYNWKCQPINNNSILIAVTGNISTNDSIYCRKFTETIIIQRDIFDNWYILNTIFQLLPP